MSKTAPYGTWESPITGETIVSTNSNIVFDDVIVDRGTNPPKIYYLQESPSDGRCIVVAQDTDKPVLPDTYSARTLVQEYGGAPAVVYKDIIYFSHYTGNPKNPNPDNIICTINVKDEKKTVTRVTPVNKLWRYANFAIHPTQTNLLVSLREDHTDDPDGKNPKGVVNTICLVDTSKPDNDPTIIIHGAGFYATPVLNPSCTKIAWQEWDLPWMPWQGSSIYVANVDPVTLNVKLESKLLVKGDSKNGTKSATFPSWIKDTTLAYITDANNQFQNPYIYDTETKKSTAIFEKDLDFAEPAWNLGLYPYAILGNGTYGAFTAFEKGRNILYIIDLTASQSHLITPFTYTVAQHVRAVNKDTFVFTASQAAAPSGVIKGTVHSDKSSVDLQVLKPSAKDTPFPKYISEPITDTVSGGHQIYIVYYLPKNPFYSGPDGKKPPCILNVHGGPTGLEPQALNWIKMFYTSRGFVWLDVNYRGSSGYGRVYAEGLRKHWGEYDIQDCKDAATYLASKGIIDGDRVAIRGGSAGAYTTLSSVTFALNPQSTYPKSACAAYGCVADVVTLAKAAEKFEIEYVNTLLGDSPWGPRNPIDHADKMKRPLLMLQGLIDGVVPPTIVLSFLEKSIAATSLVSSAATPSQDFAFYPNEAHHWHQGSTIQNALSREFHWYLDTLL
ncbi:alpha/beta-hydrolase [Imleria badia]|nr:alpha/beta-hydrolase [Imleria badia]